MAKTYANTFIYSKYSDYDKNLYDFILNAERIDAKSEAFNDVIFDVKRRKISDNLTKIITSDNVVICSYPGKPLTQAFKAFVAHDINDGKKIKAFIDVTDCITLNNGVYVCRNLGLFISRVVNAMTAFIYNMAENRLMSNANILKEGCAAWAHLFGYIMDRIYKISGVINLKRRMDYMSSIYYQVCLMGKDLNTNEDSIKANAIRISNIDPREAAIVNTLLEGTDFTNIKHFTDAVARVVGIKDMRVDVIVDYWMKNFGPGTVFGLEYFPAFSAMMTDAYIGAYANQQGIIEKIAGQEMVAFSKTILQIGASV